MLKTHNRIEVCIWQFRQIHLFDDKEMMSNIDEISIE